MHANGFISNEFLHIILLK